MSTDFRRFEIDEILSDGSPIRIRAIQPGDGERLQEHFRTLSPESVYFRFFGMKKRLSPQEVAALTGCDFMRDAVLVATRGSNAEERIVGVGCYVPPRAEVDGHRAEVAFAVSDAFQGHGVGTILLEHLAEIARANGITEFEADVLGENNRMIEVFAQSGFRVKRYLEGGVFHVSFPTAETSEHEAAHAARERTAAARSVRPLLAPASVAIVGASRHAGSIGAALLDNAKKCGFKGPIYPVNPRAKRLLGLRAYPSVGAIGAPVELAVISVPAAQVESVIDDCARAGVRGLVVISSGFGEASPQGREMEHHLRDEVRGAGMRMVGPNCMGLLNTDPRVSLNATFAPNWPPPGNIGMLSQSGALGLALLDCARKLHIGLSTFVSVGNKADVSGNDLLAWWEEDPRTEVVLLYLESFGNPRAFARVAPAVARKKPIVAVKSGRSVAGKRAATSHSAALANLDVAVDALFRQAGVIRAETLEELFDAAVLLSSQPLPAGPRIGVITNAGGPGILFADACEAAGLTLPVLAPKTRSKLGSFLPPQAGLSNPVDLLAQAGPEDFERAIEAVGADGSVDALVTIYVPPRVSRPAQIAQAIATATTRVPAAKPVAAVFLSSEAPPPALSKCRRGSIPCYPYPENAARALAQANHYARWRERPAGKPIVLDRFATSAIRAVIDRALASAGGSAWLGPGDVAAILRASGIDYAESRRVTPGDAPAEAERMGFPLVAKAIAPGLLHKSDVGGVILGLRSAAEVKAAAKGLEERMARIGAGLEGILLQREIAGGLEVLVGVATDPIFGPLLVCGMGGVLAELLGDVSYRLTPVTDVDAAEMIGKLRMGPLLDGYRGSPPADREALALLLQRVSALVEVIPELREMDLNPVKVREPGRGAVVVDARMRIWGQA